MPFTIAHPAAVVPLRHQRLLPFAPLVIGSMMPDVLYYFPGVVGQRLPSGHSLSGSLLMCLPAGLIILGLFLLLRRPLVMLLPAPHRQFLLERSTWRPRATLSDFVRVLLALEVGIWSHICWDEFTHKNRWLVAHVALLRAPVMHLSGRTLELFRVLQYAGTAGGMLLIAVCYAAALRRATPRREEGTDRWRIALLVTICAGALLAAAAEYFHVRGHINAHPLYDTVTTTVAVFIAAYVAAAVIAAPRLRRQTVKET